MYICIYIYKFQPKTRQNCDFQQKACSWDQVYGFESPHLATTPWQPQNGGFCSESQKRFIKGYHSFGTGVCLGISLILNPNQS